MAGRRERGRWLRLGQVEAVAVGCVLLGIGGSALADPQPVPVPAVPLQIQPVVPEVGMGDWTPPAEGSQPGDPAQGGGGTVNGGGSDSGSSDALGLMQQQSWGQQASSAAQGVGVNPNALAATCMIESGCNSSAQNGSSTGAFQMQPAAFQDGLNTALKADPALASQIVPGSAGINDPLTQSIAASGYLLQAQQALQTADISNPTVVDARGYYEFGPTDGENIARADPSTPMSAVVRASSLQANNISPDMTVAQWQADAASKMGGAGNQTIKST